MRRTGSQGSDRERVLDATDIVRLVGEHLALKPKGREYVCLCPFHDDHKPSMYVAPHKQIYHCFSCGAGGNAIDFVMNFHGLEFLEALKLLAERAGVDLTPPPARREAVDETAAGESEPLTRADLLGANEFAESFYKRLLAHPEHGAAARGELERRGVSAEMIEAFGLGCAPDRWDGLERTIAKKGLSSEAFVEAGLLKARREGAGRYDAFRNRLIFPIHDQIGRPIAFGARRLNEEDEPKYINSPESRLFDKSATLYGLRQAFRSIQAENQAIVAEGYTDVIACHQAGVTNVVATLGTALTSKHAATLRRLCDTVILLFDGDAAGQKAADRAVEVFFTEPIDVRIALLPGGQDPDDLLKSEGGAERLREALASAEDALEHRFRLLRHDLAEAGLSRRTRVVEEQLARLVDLGLAEVAPIRRRLILKRLAQIAGVPEDVVIEAMPRARRGRERGEESTSIEERAVTAIEHALGCLLCDPSLVLLLDESGRDIMKPEVYPPGPTREVARAVSKVWGAPDAPVESEGADISLKTILVELDDSEARRRATALASEVERITEGDHDRLAEHLRSCLLRARRDDARRATAMGAVETAAGSESLIERLRSRQETHRELGGDPLAAPRAEWR